MNDKYKDAPPSETVKKILGIYEELGLDLSCEITEKRKGIYSAIVSDSLRNWNTCGKGTTKDYCLASAYAESVEHICGYFAYSTNAITDEARKYKGFLRYPDEKIEHIAETHNYAPCVMTDMILAYSEDGKRPNDDKVVLKVWSKYLGNDKASFVPYYSIREDKEVMLPDDILWNLCGTNGNGAGNTPEEAIGHGLDEICERYAKYQIYKNRLTPPKIPMDYVERTCPELFNIISDIERTGQYRIVVKDASLGKKLPVVSVLMVDRINQRYLVNFGSHPIFEIALERCFTEMFQLFTLGTYEMKRKGMTKWNEVTDESIDSVKNWVSLLRDDSGIISDNFFAGKSSWEFEIWEHYPNYSNKLGMNEQLKKLLAISEDIYVRDLSFLGFPVYRIYIPKISTTHLAFNESQLNSFQEATGIVENCNKISSFDSDTLNHMKTDVFSSNMFASSLLFRNMSEAMTNSLLAAIEFDLGNFSKAKEILKEQDDRFCSCALRELELADNKVLPEKRDELLHLFFGRDELHYAICWRSNNVFLDLIRKYVVDYQMNIGGNTAKDSTAVDELHMKVKEYMLKHVPSQIALRKVLA